MSDYDDAMKALEAIGNEGATTDDQLYALRTIVEYFKPYAGDDPAEAKTRKVANCRCRNCGFVSAAFSVPSDIRDSVRAGVRRSICPSCYSTEILFSPAAVEKND